MRYKVIKIEPSGNGVSYLLHVDREPSWWDSLVGRSGGRATFLGPQPKWVRMDGQVASRHEQRDLNALWEQQAGTAPEMNPWLAVQPLGDLENSQMEGRAAGVPPSPNRKVAKATGEPVKT